MKNTLKKFAVCGLQFAGVVGLWTGVAFGDGVKYRGIFVNDEDWNLRPWAVKHFGKSEGIGTNAYKRIFALMKKNGLNVIWPAMHEGGYEFATRPENMALAAEWGILVGSSHCEAMLRNNAYLSKAQKEGGMWDWTKHRDFIIDFWKVSTERYATNDVLWTVGMRGIHDGPMRCGTNAHHKIEILEDVFKTQYSMLPPDSPKLFCPYKEVLELFNAGLRVPCENTTIMWVDDNYGYIRRLGSPTCEGYGGGIYYHINYNGWPHGYLQLCTTPPALLWYELVQKCANNGVRDVWMINAGDVFQAEILLYALGKFAEDPDWWMMREDPQTEVLGMWVENKLGVRSEELGVMRERIVAHLNDYYNLGFIRKPEFMNVDWVARLPESVKTNLIARYEAHLVEDLAIEKELGEQGTQDTGHGTEGTRLEDEYYRTVGFQSQFLAQAGLIHLKGLSRDYAQETMDALNRRFDEIHGGGWAGFWTDTVTEKTYRQSTAYGNGWSSVMQWAWNEPQRGSRHWGHNSGNTTAYAKEAVEPLWLEPVANTPANGGAWTRVTGLGTSSNAFALLPVKPGIGEGAMMEYDLAKCCQCENVANTNVANGQLGLGIGTGNIGNIGNNLILQFLPDFALWPGIGMRVKVVFDNGEEQIVEVPKSDSNIGMKDKVRNAAVQDNFIRVKVTVPDGAKSFKIVAVDPGVVIDRVGVVAGKKPPTDNIRKARPIARTDGAAEEIVSSPLYRKTISVIGDSYVQNHHRPVEETWHYRLAEKYQMQYLNYGRNGNPLIVPRTYKQKNTILRRFEHDMQTVPDYVVVVAGHNDALSIRQKLNAEDSGKSGLPPDPAKVEEFRKGLVEFVGRLKVKFPSAKIVFVSPWNVQAPGFAENLSPYRELLPGLGVAFYDAAALSGLDPHDKEGDKAKLWQGPDDTAHLSKAGHTIMLEKIEPFFRSL